jgi:protease IV
MSKGTKIFLGVIGGIFVLLLVFIVGLVIFLEVRKQNLVRTNSVLVLNISGNLPEFVFEDPMAEALGLIPKQQSFSSVLTQLRKAKVDSRIGGVILNIEFPNIGWGKADELRRAIKDFRSSGKPVYAYLNIGTTKEYYIATATDKIFVPPSGDIYINGLIAEVMFFRGSLDKLGIEPQVIQIGKYKNAPDQFTRKEMSPEHREAINSILDDYFNRLISVISESRNKSPEEVKPLIDEAPYNALQAKDLGLIDDALYIDQVYDEMKKALGYKDDEKLRTVSGEKYREVSAYSLGLNKGERIAIIFATGSIDTGSGNLFTGETLGSNLMVKAINDAASDDSIKAIVLRVDSPGGSALASDLIWRAVENAKAKKPVVVSMSDVAASGGYYISCGANKIVAESSTITGSIGVFLGKPVLRGLYDWLGISNEYVMRGKNAGIFRETERWTSSEEAKMREVANKIYYTDFVPKVAKGRNKTVEEVDAIGQGRVWTGLQAKERGLVDEIGGLERAIEIAKELAGIPTDQEVQRVVYPKPKTFVERLFGVDEEDSYFAEYKFAEYRKNRAIETLPPNLKKAVRYAILFERMSKGEAMMLMPFELIVR